MERRLPRLMPMPGPASATSDSYQVDDSSSISNTTDKATSSRKRRRQVSAACANCRKRKERCDDKRPTCGACARRGAICNNGTKDDDSSLTTTLKSRNAALLHENAQLRDLFAVLRGISPAHGHEVLTRLRAADDPIRALKTIYEAPLLLSRPASSSVSELLDPRLEKLELLALQESPIRVDARPWTAVASDGLVSELISSFFIWDDAFLMPMIDRDAFLTDMRSGNIANAKYCSPFLVNAICASRCQYRFAAYEMFHRLDVEATYSAMRYDKAKALDRRILSRLAWGLFCFESIVAHVYLEISMLPPPTIPRHFERPSGIFSHGLARTPNVDMFGNRHTRQSKSPPFVPGAIHLACDVALMLYSSMQWNMESEGSHGSEEDLRVRRRKLDEVREWIGRLPLNMQYDVNFTPQTYYLSAFTNEVIISILRPLPPLTEIEPGMTAKALCLSCCKIDTDNMDCFVRTYSLHDYTILTLCGVYNSILILVFHMADPAAQPLFAEASRLILDTSNDFPMSRFILQSIKAMSWRLKVPLPAAARPYYDNLGNAKESLRHVPISFALPAQTQVQKVLTHSSAQKGRAEDMGTLLTKWSAMSIG
ncbi:hypothetical protein E4U35_000441 [Claviceps purpurea]|nr:hypothetical protein E4U35_000441 [Claviceps purpurea]KAG6278532.1 hypothetical protein E4U47_005352 [Claviceps purpurea]KAG6316937.1 hypothetical protein E4U44_000342 [Claviceps purpurea]